MTTTEEKLTQARKLIQDTQLQRVRLETQLDAAQKRKQELSEECRLKNIDPDNLTHMIDGIEAEIEKKVEQLEKYLPQDDRNIF